MQADSFEKANVDAKMSPLCRNIYAEQGGNLSRNLLTPDSSTDSLPRRWSINNSVVMINQQNLKQENALDQLGPRRWSVPDAAVSPPRKQPLTVDINSIYNPNIWGVTSHPWFQNFVEMQQSLDRATHSPENNNDFRRISLESTKTDLSSVGSGRRSSSDMNESISSRRQSSETMNSSRRQSSETMNSSRRQSSETMNDSRRQSSEVMNESRRQSSEMDIPLSRTLSVHGVSPLQSGGSSNGRTRSNSRSRSVTPGIYQLF